MNEKKRRKEIKGEGIPRRGIIPFDLRLSLSLVASALYIREADGADS